MAEFIFIKKQPQDFPENIGLPEHLPLETGPYELVELSPEYLAYCQSSASRTRQNGT
jgi:hypothetical protein